jgi:protein Jumonji
MYLSIFGVYLFCCFHLKIPRGAQDRFSKLDTIYCKYLLPYATLSDDERSKLLQKVDSQQNRQSIEDEDEDECIIKGSSMPLSTFYRIARNTFSVWFPNANFSATDTSVLDPAQVKEHNYIFLVVYF